MRGISMIFSEIFITPAIRLVKSERLVLFEARYIEPIKVVKHENIEEYISIGAYRADS
ncbi:unknown [Ruminococcus sp. CAG:579]|nr:unknown [Ruminococcus sp. CAG:579]